NLEPLLADQAAFLVGNAVGDVAARQTAGFVAEEVEFAGLRVEARVGGHGGAAQGAPVIVFPQGFQAARVDLHGPGVFLEGEQATAVEDGRRVGHAAALALHARVVGEGVAISAVEATARGAL